MYHDLLPAEPGYANSRPTALDTSRWRRVLTAGGWFSDIAIEAIEWHEILTAQTARELWSTFPNIAELPRLTVIYAAPRTTT